MQSSENKKSRFFSPTLIIEDLDICKLEQELDIVLNKSMYNHLRSVAANLCYFKEFYIPLNNRYWPDLSRRYNPLKLNYFGLKKVIDILEEKKIIKKNFKKGEVSSFISLEPNYRKIFGYKAFHSNKREYLILRNEDKQRINYKDTLKTESQRRAIHDLNQFNNQFEFKVDDQLFSPSVLRIFKNTMKEGGRFYGEYQTFSKEKRSRITIDQEETIELDYINMHIILAFNILKIDYVDRDFYYHPVIKRDIIKKVILICINSSSRREAIFAIAGDLNMTNKDSRFILDSIESYSPILKQVFYKEIGLKLQKLESEILFDVLRTAWRKSIPIISVHDSVIIKKADAEIMRDLMISIPNKKWGIPLNIK